MVKIGLNKAAGVAVDAMAMILSQDTEIKELREEVKALRAFKRDVVEKANRACGPDLPDVFVQEIRERVVEQYTEAINKLIDQQEAAKQA